MLLKRIFVTFALSMSLTANSIYADMESMNFIPVTIGLASGNATLWMMYSSKSEKIWTALPGYKSYKKWEKPYQNSKVFNIAKHVFKISVSLVTAVAGYYLTQLITTKKDFSSQPNNLNNPNNSISQPNNLNNPNSSISQPNDFDRTSTKITSSGISQYENPNTPEYIILQKLESIYAERYNLLKSYQSAVSDNENKSKDSLFRCLKQHYKMHGHTFTLEHLQNLTSTRVDWNKRERIEKLLTEFQFSENQQLFNNFEYNATYNVGRSHDNNNTPFKNRSLFTDVDPHEEIHHILYNCHKVKRGYRPECEGWLSSIWVFDPIPPIKTPLRPLPRPIHHMAERHLVDEYIKLIFYHRHSGGSMGPRIDMHYMDHPDYINPANFGPIDQTNRLTELSKSIQQQIREKFTDYFDRSGAAANE